jgi:hypothetical protein
MYLFIQSLHYWNLIRFEAAARSHSIEGYGFPQYAVSIISPGIAPDQSKMRRSEKEIHGAGWQCPVLDGGIPRLHMESRLRFAYK